MYEKHPKKELADVLVWLSQKMQCPFCGFNRNLAAAQIVPPGPNAPADVLMHADCADCRSSLMFAIKVSGRDVHLVGLVTDLVKGDLLRFQSQKLLTSDNVIDWHNYWSDFKGDIVKTLGF